jgi:hypothetical protein
MNSSDTVSHAKSAGMPVVDLSERKYDISICFEILTTRALLHLPAEISKSLNNGIVTHPSAVSLCAADEDNNFFICFWMFTRRLASVTNKVEKTMQG